MKLKKTFFSPKTSKQDFQTKLKKEKSTKFRLLELHLQNSSIFHKTLKNLFEAFSSTKYFFKKGLAPSFLRLDDTLTLCRKSEHFYKQFWRKILDKQTNM